MIIGKRVILEEIDPANIEQLRQWRNDPKMRKYYREYKDISKDKQDWWYKDRGNNTNPNHIYFQIMERYEAHKDSEVYQEHGGLPRKLVGSCGLHYIDWRLRSAEFGVFVMKQGKGLGGEALKLMFDYGFRECNFHKIWAEVYDENQALDIYTKKLGMKVDGKLRHSQFCNGKYIDSTMLSVLEDEWFEMHGER